jgi:hypothetical protein
MNADTREWWVITEAAMASGQLCWQRAFSAACDERISGYGALVRDEVKGIGPGRRSKLKRQKALPLPFALPKVTAR